MNTYKYYLLGVLFYILNIIYAWFECDPMNTKKWFSFIAWLIMALLIAIAILKYYLKSLRDKNANSDRE